MKNRNLFQYSKRLLVESFFTSFRAISQIYVFKYVLRNGSKIREKIFQKSAVFECWDRFIIVSLIACLCLSATPLYTLYTTLDPQSAEQALAFYELYPTTVEGVMALERVQRLFRTQIDVRRLTDIVNRLQGSGTLLDEVELQLIEQLAAHFPNRTLKGYLISSEEEVLQLPPSEIDIGTALMLSQADGNGAVLARNYSALLDLMALQIAARLPEQASAATKIEKINRFLFEEMHIRFPPQSVFAKEIDRYTFLASVMDDHLGVCLGVTALYLAIAQRLDLPLEIITPPGHIFVRYREGKKIINIETTARGIDLPSETYLGVNTYRLKQRTLKEVVGMTHVNQASVYLHTEKYGKALASYQRALPYMPDDLLVKELLACTYLFEGEEKKGRELLRQVKGQIPDDAIAGHVLAEDYLNGKIDHEGIKAVFTLVDEGRDSLMKKKQRLEKTLAAYPEFRDGHLQLGITWVQLNRGKEALQALDRYHALNPKDPQASYYLAVLHGERHDYRRSWEYLVETELIVAEHLFCPKALRDLREELCLNCPP